MYNPCTTRLDVVGNSAIYENKMVIGSFWLSRNYFVAQILLLACNSHGGRWLAQQ